MPHGKSPGHTRYGLAYSPKIPAGLRVRTYTLNLAYDHIHYHCKDAFRSRTLLHVCISLRRDVSLTVLWKQVAQGGEIRTHEVLIENGHNEALQLTVDGDELAMEGLGVMAYSVADAACSVEALRFEHIATTQPPKSTGTVGTKLLRKRVVHWRQLGGVNHGVVSSDLKQLIGESVTLSFTLPHGGVLYSFAFDSLQ